MDYLDQFEELRSKMLTINPTLNEDYFIQSFVSGLNEELRLAIKMLSPTNLRRFLLILFDDILVYSKHMDDHLLHLPTTLVVLRQNKLHAKTEKCYFDQAI